MCQHSFSLSEPKNFVFKNHLAPCRQFLLDQKFKPHKNVVANTLIHVFSSAHIANINITITATKMTLTTTTTTIKCL